MPIGVNIFRDYHYQIKVGHRLLSAQDFERYDPSNIAVVSDANVRELHVHNLADILRKQYLPLSYIEIPSGEKGKTRKQVERILSILGKEGFDRDSMILAFGGGCVGDTAGFAASRYLRGIKYVQVPTTLLAMVDSSIGGKVGVNTPEGKNMDGAFYQPFEVLSDTSLLETLPSSEWKNGLAEIVKYGIACDPQLFDMLEENPNPSIWKQSLLLDIIRRCADIKKDIVEEDELETKGAREILNYGHTVGHAIERVSRYKIPHGVSVGIGMGYEARIALELGILKVKEYDRIVGILKDTGLFSLYDGNEDLLEVMKGDKKNKDGVIRMALPEGVGMIAHARKMHTLPVKEEVIKKALRKVN